MPFTVIRFPGVLNSQELLVAEAIQARAWEALGFGGAVAEFDESVAKARLGAIILRLMSDHSKSMNDLATAAVDAFQAR